MAAHPVLIVGDGVIEIPEQLQGDPRFQKGAKIEAVPVADAKLHASNGDWRRLRGLFKDVSVHLNDELEKDRLAEAAADERMLRGHTG